MGLTIEQALGQGIAAHKEGRTQEAERLYRAILQSQPTHPDANHNLGLIAVSVNKVDTALPLFKTALEANPKIEQFWLSYIDALISEKQIETANQVIEKGREQGVALEKLNEFETQLTPTTKVSEAKLAPQKKRLTSSGKRKELSVTKKKMGGSKNQPIGGASPSDAEINSLTKHFQAGQYGDAEKLALTLTERFPSHQFAWKVLGAILKQTGRVPESLVPSQKAVELSPQDAIGHSNLGVTLRALGRFADAEASYRQAIALKPEYAQAHNNLGNTLKERGKLEEAEASYRQAIELKPDYAQAHNNLGITLQEQGSFGEAEASYTQAIALKPDFVEAHFNLANTLQKLGRLAEAETSYRQTIALKSDYAEAHNNLGNTLKELGKLEEAEVSYRQSIVSKPDFAEAHSNLGNTLRDLSRLDEAEASSVQAIALMPDFAEAHCNLGITLQELGRLAEAEASYKQAMALKPDFAEAHYNLANTLQALGRFEEAESWFMRAIALKPDDALAHYNLGIALKELGRFQEAETSLTQAILLKPDYLEARNTRLTCLYLLGKRSQFFDELDYLIDQKEASAVIGSFTCRSALKYGVKKENLFCKDPLKHVLQIDLNAQYDFKEIFVKTAKTILNEQRTSSRAQGLLTNGYQTSGNLFDSQNDLTGKIQNIIRLEIERYRDNFKNSEEGLIKGWPSEYSLHAWLISMNSGGELKPHIHNQGWLSGSVYINVPPKSKADSGNLVVSIGEEKDATDTRINEKKIIDVVTGNLVLFPASLTHYTIPFESEEERIVLAFDMAPK